MSSLIVSVARVEALDAHPNADALEIAKVLGWQVVVPKGRYQLGDKVVYFPPDTVIPESLSDRFGVTKYLSKGRIRCAKLRGEPSFGLVVPPDDPTWEEGANVAEAYGATKYNPPVRPSAGDAAAEHMLFPGFTDMENLRNFPRAFEDGEEVVVTEKIHGTSCRIGVVDGEWMAGSKGLRRVKPETDEGIEANYYWFPMSLAPVRALIEALAAEHRQVILYGEIYGRGVQSMTYGLEKTGFAFRAFDLLLDGRWVDVDDFRARCERHGVELVPLVARGPFSIEWVRSASSGKTLLMGSNPHIREGVVVRPIAERHSYKMGRVILKYVSDAYLFGSATDYTEA